MKFLFPLFIAGLLTFCSCQQKPEPDQAGPVKQMTKPDDCHYVDVIDTSFHNGDIIFQSSKSGQSYAIQLATHSQYSHCGLLFNENGQWFVYEAVQPVKKTPFTEWIKHGDNEYYVVKRLKDADTVLTKDKQEALRKSVRRQMGKDYDLAFSWSDERLYCSELVWKSYKEITGLEIGATKPLGEYDLSNPVVKKKLEERYGNTIPKNEPMISPGSIFESELLVTIRQ